MDDTRLEIVPVADSGETVLILELTKESEESMEESEEQMGEWGEQRGEQRRERMGEWGERRGEWGERVWEEPMEEPKNEALKNIHNLICIQESTKLRVALADWECSEQHYRKRVHRKKKVLWNTRNEVITFTGFFLALQVLLLTAAAISSSSQCTNLGFLLAVSGFVTFCALAFVCHMEVTMRRLQSVIVLEKAVQKTFTSRLQQLRQEGEFFDFERTNYDIIKRTKFALSLFGFFFTAMTWVAFSHRYIWCTVLGCY